MLFCDIGKVNFPLKIDFKIKFQLETDMKKLFESKKKVTAIDPFLQYEQVLLDKNFRQYLETIMVSKKILRMGVQKTPIQKIYEISTGSDSININFLGSNRQFDWLEISLVYDKSYKHTTIYDSYNVELAAKYIKSVKLENFTEIYTLTSEKNYSIDNLTQKHLLCKQYVAWSCGGCSTAPLTDYVYSPVYQELTEETGYFGYKSNERIYIDLRASAGYTNEMEKLERNNSKITLYITLKVQL